MNNAKINPDGSFTVNVDDGYNFEEWEYNKKPKCKDDIGYDVATIINNTALGQQQKGQLNDYVLSTPVTYTKEEIEEILRRLR